MANHPPSGGSVGQHATVMFADISGFTALGERLDPEQVIDIVNGCFARLEAIVYAHGGVIDEYLGDCVKAAFGLSLTAGDGALHAVAAAMEMRDAIADYNVDRGLTPPLGIHTGLSTGAVATVPTGSEGLNRICVMGEAARVASRLEDASERGQIFVGSRTRDATVEEFDYDPVEVEAAAEIGTPVFELRGRKPFAPLRRESERRVATIMFADLIGTDDIADDERALEVEMATLFDAMRAAVREYGGVVNQYTGDGVMALFGIPNAIEDAPKQALNAALRIRELVEDYAGRRSVPLSVHIGVNTGRVVAGEIGGSVRRSFTGVGATVNMSARIKEAAPPGEIQIGPETHRLTAGHFEFRALEPMKFKGRDARMPVYRLVSRTRSLHRRKAHDGQNMASAIVGRDRELGVLLSAIRRLESGVGGAVSLVGEAGLGKTRLLSEAVAGADRRRIQVILARSISIGAGLPFHPFIDLLRSWASIDEHTEGTLALVQLGTAMEVMGAEAAEALPFIATLLGLPLQPADADRLAAMDSDAIEKFVTKHLRDLLVALARKQPTLVVMEDVHWADRSSVELLESLLGLATGVPVLFCLVMRPEFVESGGSLLEVARGRLLERYDEVTLEPLGGDEVGELVRNLLDIDDLSDAVRTTITEKAGGNPFFIEEIVRELVDAGAVAFHDGRFRVTEKIGDVVIPSTVQEVIMVRIDRLDETKRHILQVASIIGRSFSSAVIAGLVERVLTLSEDLALLRDKQILVERRPQWDVTLGQRDLAEELEYVFKHALAQETIYSSILLQTRRELHGKVAAAIESRFAGRLKDFYGTLSWHFLRAEDLPKAESYCFLAGETAARAGAAREALQFFLEAARLDAELHGEQGDPHHREQIEKNLGLALMNTGRLPESLPHFDRALELLGERVPSSPTTVQLTFAGNFAAVLVDLFALRRLRRRRPGTTADREFFEILNARARASVTSDPRRIFYDNIGGVRRVNGISARFFEPACPMYAVAGGMFSFSGLSMTVARRFLRRAEACRTQGRLSHTFDCRSLRFTINYLDGEWRDEDLLENELVDDAIRNGLFWDVQTYLGLACDRLMREGRFDDAGRHLARLAELRDAYDFAFAGTNHDGERAMFLLERRELEEGRRASDRYLEDREEYGLRVLALGTRAAILVHSGDLRGAGQDLEVAGRILKEVDVIPPWHAAVQANARLLFDIAMATSGDRDVASVLLRDASAALRTSRTVASQRTEALCLAGTAHALAGHPSRARRLWLSSIRTGERLGARPALARTRLEISRRLPPGETLDGLGPERHLELATSTFSELGLEHDMKSARSA